MSSTWTFPRTSSGAFPSGEFARLRNLPSDGAAATAPVCSCSIRSRRTVARCVAPSHTREPLGAVEHVLGVGMVFPESQSRTAKVDYITANVAALTQRCGRARRRRRARGDGGGRRRMIDEVRVALTALRAKGAPRPGQLSVFELEGGLGAYLGIDESGRPHLLMEVDPREPLELRAVAVAALEVGARELDVDGRTASFLDVTCLFESVAEVFDHFIVAVLEPPEGGAARAGVRVGGGARTVEAVLGAESGSAGSGEARGRVRRTTRPPRRRACRCGQAHRLVGRTVRRSSRHPPRCHCGRGQDDTVAHVAPRDDPRRGPACGAEGGTLHLHFVRLEEVPSGGRSVASVVDELLSEGVPAEALFDALSAAGIPIPNFPPRQTSRFDVRERLTVPVDDESPRIVPRVVCRRSPARWASLT